MTFLFIILPLSFEPGFSGMFISRLRKGIPHSQPTTQLFPRWPLSPQRSTTKGWWSSRRPTAPPGSFTKVSIRHRYRHPVETVRIQTISSIRSEPSQPSSFCPQVNFRSNDALFCHSLIPLLFPPVWKRHPATPVTALRAPGGLNREVFLPFIALIKAKCTVHNMSGRTDYRTTGHRVPSSHLPPPSPIGRSSAQVRSMNDPVYLSTDV